MTDNLYCILIAGTNELMSVPVCYGNNIDVTCCTRVGSLVEWNTVGIMSMASPLYNPQNLVMLPIIDGQLMIISVTIGHTTVSSEAEIQRIQQDATVTCTDDTSSTSWNITVEGITVVNTTCNWC